MDSAISNQEYSKGEKEGVVYESSIDEKRSNAQADTASYSTQNAKSARRPEQNVSSGDLLSRILDAFSKLFSSIRSALKNMWASAGDQPVAKEDAQNTAANQGNEALKSERAVSNGQMTSETSGLNHPGSSDRSGTPSGGATSAANSYEKPSGRVARNTSLLTQYDAHGRIVTPDASDQQRILHGDRGLRNGNK